MGVECRWLWKFSQLPLTLKSKGNPSAEFKAAAKQWSKGATVGTIKTNLQPTNVYNPQFVVEFTVDKDTEVEVDPGNINNANIPYDEVKIKSGSSRGRSGLIKVSDMRDTGGGTPLMSLP